MLKITEALLGTTRDKAGGGLESSDNLEVDDRYVSFAVSGSAGSRDVILSFDETNSEQAKLTYNILCDLEDTTILIDMQSASNQNPEGIFLLGFGSLDGESQVGAIVDDEKSSLSIGSISFNASTKVFTVKNEKSIVIPFDPFGFRKTELVLKLTVSAGVFSASLDNPFDQESPLFIDYDYGLSLDLDNRPTIAGLNVLEGRTIKDFTACGLTSIEDNPNAIEVDSCDRVALNIREALLGTVSIEPFHAEAQKGVLLAGNTQTFKLSGLTGSESGRLISSAAVTLDVFSDSTGDKVDESLTLSYDSDSSSYVGSISGDYFISSAKYTFTVRAKFGASTGLWKQTFRADHRMFDVSGNSVAIY